MTPAAFRAAGLKPRGELWAAMLDTKASWDDLIRRHAPDERTRDAILVNPLYENITARFVQSHDYIAMERLHELHSSGRYDLIVVDTPPTRNALDFLDAPERMEEFFGGRLLRWLTAPHAQPRRRRRVAAVPHHRRPDPRRPLPAGHRRVLRPPAVDGEGLRRAGPAASASSWATPARRSASSRRWRPRRPARPRFFVAELQRRKLPLGRGDREQGAPRRPAAGRPRGDGVRVPRRRRRPGRRRGRPRRRADRPRAAGARPRWARASPTTPSWRRERPSSAPSWPRPRTSWSPSRSSTSR